MTDVLQCPYCELRFASKPDRDQHIAFDHPGKSPEGKEENEDEKG